MRLTLPLHLPQRLAAHHDVVIAGGHAVLFALSYLAAFALRHDLRLPREALAAFATTVLYLVAVRLVVFQRFGLFRSYWRHVGLRDMVTLATAVTLGSLCFLALVFLVGVPPSLPRSVLALEWLTTLFLAAGPRFAARALQEGQLPLRTPTGTRTFVIGAGEAGEQFLRQVQHDGRAGMHVVGVIDDNPETHGRSLHGVPILGGTADLRRLAGAHAVSLLVIAMPSASSAQLRRVVDCCIEAGVSFKILPTLEDLLSGRAGVSQLRDVEIEDLLGRDPVTFDLEPVRQDLAGRSVLISGGAGSIGSELARQVARFAPARLVLLDRAESPLYFVHLEVARAFPSVEVVPVIANITNAERLEEVFRAHRPDYVFHAAAYKHVPLMEDAVVEAAWNNVVGTWRVAEAAARHGAGKFVLISTDKAVNPTSMMGATKRIAERVVLELPALQAAATDFRAVRFGNVLGSDGSVLPLFKRQLAAGQPLTVTHPDMERFFMTIPEAVQLVLMAAALPEAAGRIAVLEMGEPVRILRLAEQLVRLMGLIPHRDVPIVFTGLRPGEKLREELVAEAEVGAPTSSEKIRVIDRVSPSAGAAIEAGLRRLVGTLLHGDAAAVMGAVASLVPEYTPHVPVAAPPLEAVAGGRRTTPRRLMVAAPGHRPPPALPA